MFEAEPRDVCHDCDSCYLSFLLQSNQLEQREGSSEEQSGGDIDRVPLPEPDDEDSPAVLVSVLGDADQSLPPDRFQLTRDASAHVRIVIPYLISVSLLLYHSSNHWNRKH